MTADLIAIMGEIEFVERFQENGLLRARKDRSE